MRSYFALFALAGAASVFLSGCASDLGPSGPETKLGRGLHNVTEIVRGGEYRRSVEQNTIKYGPGIGRKTGAVHGFSRSMARSAVGLYEIATFPFPNRPGKDYGPIHYPLGPVYPDSYTPGISDDPIFATDHRLGYKGGESAAFLPNSRFSVFEW